MFDLSGKTALVTGASGGIGSKIVTALHGQGAKVILHGTRAERLASLQESFGERAYCLPADLSDREAVTKIMETAAELTGPVDILVNNAGITRDNLFMRMKDEDWDDVLAVNMTSSMLLCRSAIRSMMKARWGRIISISSILRFDCRRLVSVRPILGIIRSCLTTRILMSLIMNIIVNHSNLIIKGPSFSIHMLLHGCWSRCFLSNSLAVILIK